MSYEVTKNRVLQWIGIILVMAVFAGAYWYFQVFAGYKTSTGQTGILTSGLVGIWSFDGADVSGSTATDRSGSSNTGTISGATVTPGKVGQALSFDGVDDSVNAGNDASIQLTTGTVSAWIKTTGAGSGYRAIIVKGNAYGLFLKDNVLLLYDWGASAERTTGTSLSDGNWHFVTQVFQSGVSNGTTVYVDGVLALTTTMTVSSQGVQLGIGDSVGSSQFFAGSIDEPRVYNRTLSASEIQSLYKLGQSDEVNSGASQAGGGSRLDSGLAGYWKMDDGSGTSATDASTNGNTGTLTNGPTWGTGQIEGAVTFDGINDEITTTNNQGTGAQIKVFTLSSWFKTSTASGAKIIGLEDSQTGTGTTTWDRQIWMGTDGKIRFGVYNGYIEAVSTAALNDNTWHHAVGVSTGDNGTIALYVDGVLQQTTNIGGSIFAGYSTSYWRIGGYQNSPGWTNGADGYFTGSLDEVRVYNRSLSADEVSQLYRLTTPTVVDTSLKGYWSFNGKDLGGTSAYDRSGAGNTGTLTNGPTVIPGKVGQALEFDGSNDRVAIASSGAALNLTTTLSWSAWIYPRTFGGNSLGRIIDKNTGNSGVFFVDNSNITSGLGFAGNGGAVLASSKNNAIATNTWQHVVVTFSSGTVSFYVNGVLNNSTATAMTLASDTTAFAIGERSNGAGDRGFDGFIDEVRVYNRVLTVGEIQSLYASGQSDEVNTGASQAQGTGRLDSGLAGYWKLDDGSGTSATDASTNGNTGTLTNGPTWGTGQIGGDVVFDGVNDYINIPSPPTSIKPQARMSISAWVKRSASGEVDYIFWERDSVAQEEGIFFYFDTDNKMHFVFRISGTGYVDVASTTTVTDTNWHMLTATLGASNLLTFYVDGTYAGSGTTTTPNTGVTIGNALIGARNDGTTPDAYGSFSIDEFRFYSRTLSADEVSQLYRLTTPTGTDTSLKGYWSFNGKDISGTTAFDRSGAGNTGSLYNGPTVTPGKVGQALDFDAVNDHIETTDSSAVDFGDTDDFTLSGWFNRDTFTDTNALVGKRSGFAVGDAGYIAYIDATTDQLIFQLSDGTDVYTITSASTFTATGWHHFTVVWDQDSAANSEIYIDGVDDNATDTGTIGNIGDLSNAFGLYIAARSDGGALFDGKIDEVRIYNRALTMGEITGLYNAGR